MKRKGTIEQTIKKEKNILEKNQWTGNQLLMREGKVILYCFEIQWQNSSPLYLITNTRNFKGVADFFKSRDGTIF